jgi:hypothetical protein
LTVQQDIQVEISNMKLERGKGKLNSKESWRLGIQAIFVMV